jgi:hypothetical protein
MVIYSMDILEAPRGILCQQCNCKGVMGAGLAKAYRDKWPRVYKHYSNAFLAGQLKLGKIQLVTVDERAPIIVANIMGQYDYGREKKQYTHLHSVEIALKKVKYFRDTFQRAPGLNIYIPYKMGCSLGGAKWEDMLEILNRIVPDAMVCRKPSHIYSGERY